MLLFLAILICSMSIVIAAGGCWGSGWGGCNDAGCNKDGGYCRNFGIRPNNDCRCVYGGK